jgi:hypothetical protein
MDFPPIVIVYHKPTKNTEKGDDASLELCRKLIETKKASSRMNPKLA